MFFLKKLMGRFTRLSSFQIIILGFAGIILIASLLLMLPVSSQGADTTPFFDCLFTATSAVCVTGLVIQDTATHWSFFGQLLILIMIQIGGMGVVTMASSITMIAGKKIGLMQRSTMQEAVAAPQVGGIVKFNTFIIRTMLLIELIGAILLAPVMIGEFGASKGLWYALFHSVSAFCNAGFDLMGIREPFSSLTGLGFNIYLNIIIMLLIITGGIGFLTWEDMATKKFHFSSYRMQSKVILLTSAILIFIPAFFYFFHEFGRQIWGDLSVKDRTIASLFTAVTARTAGFNTVDLASLSMASLTVMIVLMLIGGAPGSTAGGLKITTIAVLFLSSVSVFRRREQVHCFGRSISINTVRNAATILLMYLTLFLTGAIIINCAEGLPMEACLFEAASAIGTVGVTLGITPDLGVLSRLVLIVMMFLGRVGGLTLIYASVAPPRVMNYKLPQEKITVG